MARPMLDQKTNTFLVNFHWEGKRYTRSIGTDNAKIAREAQARVNHLLSRIKGGIEPIPEGVSIASYVFDGQKIATEDEERRKKSLRTFVKEYLEYAAPPRKSENTFNTERIHTRHLEKYLEFKRILDLPLAQITPEFFDGYKKFREGVVSPTTINKELETFRLMFQLAVKYRYIPSNSVKEVDKYKKANVPHRFMTKAEIDREIQDRDYTEEEKENLFRFRYLTESEIGGLLELAREKLPFLHPILVTCAYTGARRSELLRLTWADVDLKANKIWLTSLKGSRTEKLSSRDVDMHPTLAAVLKTHRERAGREKNVFVNGRQGEITPQDLTERLWKLVKGTDFEGIGFHTLRHSFASNLAARGVDQRIIDHFMGHQTKEMRMRYQPLFPERREKAILKLKFGGGVS
jgi:integrase